MFLELAKQDEVQEDCMSWGLVEGEREDNLRYHQAWG